MREELDGYEERERNSIINLGEILKYLAVYILSRINQFMSGRVVMKIYPRVI